MNISKWAKIGSGCFLRHNEEGQVIGIGAILGSTLLWNYIDNPKIPSIVWALREEQVMSGLLTACLPSLQREPLLLARKIESSIVLRINPS